MSHQEDDTSASGRSEEDQTPPPQDDHHEVSRLEYVARHGLIPPKRNILLINKPRAKRAGGTGPRRGSDTPEEDIRKSVSEETPEEFQEVMFNPKASTMPLPKLHTAAPSSRRQSAQHADIDDSLPSRSPPRVRNPDSDGGESKGGLISAGGGNLRKKLTGLEEQVDRLVFKQDESDRRVMELEQVTQAVQGLIREMVREMGEKLMERIVQDKADVEQRLDMQTSENKRLQQYMSALKAENTALQRKLTDFEERLASVEAEVGGEA